MNINTTKRSNLYMLFFLLYLIYANVFTLIIAEQFPAPLKTAEMQILFYAIAFFPPVLLYFLLSGKDGVRALPFKKLGLANAGLVLLISFASMPVMMVLSVISTMLFPNEIGDMVTTMAIESHPVVNMIAIGVLPAVLEEFIFRGIILRGYRGVRLITAAFVNGLFFAVMHLGPQQFLYAFALGFLFVLLVHYTKSIFAPMIAHFTINGTQMLLMYYPGYAGEAVPEMEEAFVMTPGLLFTFIYIGAFFLAIVAALVVALIKYNKKTAATILLEDYLPREDLSETVDFSPVYDTLAGVNFFDPQTAVTGDEFLTQAELPENKRPRIYNWPFWVVLAIYPVFVMWPESVVGLLFFFFVFF